MTNHIYYDRAVKFMASTKYSCLESIQLISDLFQVNSVTVSADISKARKGEHHYASD